MPDNCRPWCNKFTQSLAWFIALCSFLGALWFKGRLFFLPSPGGQEKLGLLSVDCSIKGHWGSKGVDSRALLARAQRPWNL